MSMTVGAVTGDMGAHVRAIEVRQAEHRRDAAVRDEERAGRSREHAQRALELVEGRGARIDRYA